MSRTMDQPSTPDRRHPAEGRRRRRPAGRVLGMATALAVAGGAVLAGSAPASAGTAPVAAQGRAVGKGTVVPAVPANLPSAIEPLAPYVQQVSCDPTPKAGTLALGRLLASTYSGTGYAVTHDCGDDPIATEHVDGRAVDWLVSTRSTLQRQQAQSFLNWLFAADSAGRAYAYARRMGIMYIIWDGQIWGAWNPLEGWREYSTCRSHPEPAADDVCQRSQMHISLSWDGATGKDSFWSRSVSAPDYGPCRDRDLNWAAPWTAPNRKPCTTYAAVKAPKGASAVLTGLVKFSGATVGPGDDGPAVTAVQRGLGVPADGRYGPFTADAVVTFQRRHNRPPSGRMDAGTWRDLLALHKLTGPTDAVKVPAKPLSKYVGTTLRYNDRGAAVLALQKALKITQSGWFGPLTRATVVALQVRAHLQPTGVVDAATWRALGA